MLVTLVGCGGQHSEQSAPEAGTKQQAVRLVTDMAVADPARALTTIDSIEQKGTLATYDVNALRALVYHNGLQQYRLSSYYGEKAYRDSAFLADDPAGWLDNLEVLVNHCLSEKRCADGLRYAHRGVEVAREKGLYRKEAKYLFYTGLFKVESEGTSDGYAPLHQAISLMEQHLGPKPGYAEADDLIYIIGMTMNVMTRRDDTAQAIELTPRLLRALRLLEQAPDATEEVIDMRRAMTYAQLAGNYAKAGRRNEARRYEQLCGETAFSQSPFGALLLSDQLLATGQHQRLLEQMQQALSLFGEDHNLRIDIFTVKRQTYEAMGNSKMALAMADSIIAEKDSARAQSLRDDAIQLTKIYEVEEKDALIARHQSALTLHRIVTAFVVAVALLLAFILWYGWHQRRVIKRKNKASADTIREMLRYKEQSEIASSASPEAAETAAETAAEAAAEIAAETAAESVADAAAAEKAEAAPLAEELLFRRLDQLIKNKRLYADPKMTRADVAAAAKVPQYQFATLFQTYTGLSYKDYMTNLRMEYAAQLLRDNDNLSVGGIANMCGYASRQAFYNQFTKKYGLTPIEYKESLT